MISRRSLSMILVNLIVIRIVMVICLVNGIPETKYHKGWFFHHGGDEEEYFRLASSLAKFQPVKSYRTLGFPLSLVPFIWSSRGDTIDDILPYVAIFNSCILSAATIFLIAILAAKFTKDKRIAILSAALWTFLPYLMKISISLLSPRHSEVAGIWLTHWMGLQVLSGPLSLFLVLSSIYIFLISLEKENPEYAIPLGVVAGCAVLTRPENGVLFILFSIIFLSQKKIKNWLFFISSFFITFSPQLFYNFYFHGSPLRFPVLDYWKEYLAEAGSGYKHVFSIANIPLLLGELQLKLPRPILLLVISISILIGWALIRIYKERRLSAVILTLWILLYMLVYGCFANIEIILWQYSMPFLPAITILLASAIIYIKERCIK